MPNVPPPSPQQVPHQQGAPLPPAGADPEATSLLSYGAQPGPGTYGALPPENPSYGGQPPYPAPDSSRPPRRRTASSSPVGPVRELVRATPQTGAPLPPAADDAEATTLIPPFDARSGGPAARCRPGGRPPETPDESTTMLRAVKPGQGRPQGPAQPMPQSQPMPGAPAAGDSEATQLIPGGRRGADPASRRAVRHPPRCSR
ncbi:hypothetical protein PQR15_13710 [Streptomyces lydicus]|nr:hypothetical protein [Streptomyces lydicus]